MTWEAIEAFREKQKMILTLKMFFSIDYLLQKKCLAFIQEKIRENQR